jgi:flagellar basal-body rod protein FlgG
MPDCKMPECPPASGPVRTRDVTGIAVTGGTESREGSSLFDQLPAPDVIHAVSGRDALSGQAPPRVADASEPTAPTFRPPLPLPARTNAIPLRPEGPQFPSIIEPPASAPRFPVSSPGRRIIENALPNSSAEERDVWHDALKDLSPKDVRELLRLREELGRMPASPFENRAPAGPFWSPTPSGPLTGPPIGFSGDAVGLVPDSQREASRTVAASLDAIAQAQQVLLNNVANANTDGYKRLAIAFEAASTSDSRQLSSQQRSIGAGVRLGPLAVDMTQGRMRHTDRPLDLAIEGEGFFQLEDVHTHQTFYTRCGRFSVNAKGELIWRAASRELQLRPAVVAGPETDVQIAGDGTVRAVPSGSSPAHLPQIRVMRLPAMVELMPMGDTLFATRGDAQPGHPSESDPLAVRLRQGCLEASNVDVDHELQEMDRLLRQARALEAAAQHVQLGPRDMLAPAGEPMMLPSHFAGSLNGDRR